MCAQMLEREKEEKKTTLTQDKTNLIFQLFIF